MNATSSTAIATTRAPAKRFDIYVIDTGWNEAMSQVLKTHLEQFKTYLVHRDNCYALDQQQSMEILKAHPHLIGKDPVLVVLDSDAMVEKRKGGHGFRFCLGKVKSPAEADEKLKDLLQIVLDRKKCQNINAAVRKEVHKEGLDGAMEIIGESLESLRSE